VNPPPAPDSGELIAGKYRVERVIGEGGMGTVLAACHELLDVRVAVKVLSAELSHQPEIIARFLREARAVARLKSEHVARVMDVGILGEGQPFIVMELLEGEDLEKRVQRGPLPVQQAADFILQALEAMAHAHAIGIVHRDLKPANLFVTVTPDGREVVKVLDFGIAKLTNAVQADGARSGGLTGKHATLGSPSFMAPEQVRAAPEIDRRADIWALGAIFYELVTGRTAFGGNTIGEIFGAVLHATPTPVNEIRPDIPEGVDAVIARCLRRPVEERYADVGELARAVAPFASAAWQGHVARIEQTLQRVGKSSDPEGARTSKLGLEKFALEPFGPEAGSGPRSRPRPIFSPAPAAVRQQPAPGGGVRQIDTLPALPASNSETPAPVSSSFPSSSARSRAARIAIPVAACAVAAIAFTLLRAGAPAPAELPSRGVASSLPPSTAQPIAPVAPFAPAASFANPTPAGSSTAAAATAAPAASTSASSRTRTHSVRPPAPAASAARPPGLPSVLQSPD
jgi:eukaryotic-like serine/threonine-protein kinase